ncbi:hypothetical protein Hdeb2414_s0010g00343631 [Helianthus debilis subsp. tardiflorus]
MVLVVRATERERKTGSRCLGPAVRWSTSRFRPVISFVRRIHAEIGFGFGFVLVRSTKVNRPVRRTSRVRFAHRVNSVKPSRLGQTQSTRVNSVDSVKLSQPESTQSTRSNSVNPSQLSQLGQLGQLGQHPDAKTWNIVECTLASQVLETTSRSRKLASFALEYSGYFSNNGTVGIGGP